MTQMRFLLMLFFLLLSHPVFSEPEAAVDPGLESNHAPEPPAHSPDTKIVVITDPEFVPISQYFERFDPNRLEPSAAGPLQKEVLKSP